MAKVAAILCALYFLSLQSTYAWFWPFTSEDPVAFDHEHVTKLTKATFENHTLKEDGRFYFAKFYAPWCGHCKTLAPIWGQVAAENKNPDLEFVQVDCTANRGVCEKAAVRGFPEFKVFYMGRIGLAMIGGKDLAGMRSFVQEAIPKVRENHAKALELEAKDEDAKQKVQGGSSKGEL